MDGRALVAWNLRRIRVARGLSQERLAYDAGVDRSYVGGLERCEENPTVDILDQYAATAAEANELVAESREALTSQLRAARVIVLVLGLVLAAGQVVPLGRGWLLARPGTAAELLRAPPD
jgi:transcriptional regulator with XRE-family HTH domain